jgi:hypothetical protein
VNNVRAIYMRDVLLRPALGRVIIRADQKKNPYDAEVMLGHVRKEWQGNHRDAKRDVVCAVDIAYSGGMAYTGNIGTRRAYSIQHSNASGDFGGLWRHELGHNWSCSHYVGGRPEGKGIMGGNTPGRFSGCEVHKIFTYRNRRRSAKKKILDNEGTYTAIALPPYASYDSGVFKQAVDSSLTVDVVANDYDANGQTVRLSSHDARSAKGGTVVRKGKNLVYTARVGFAGNDYFTYKISDTSGQTATGVAVIKVVRKKPL